MEQLRLRLPSLYKDILMFAIPASTGTPACVKSQLCVKSQAS